MKFSHHVTYHVSFPKNIELALSMTSSMTSSILKIEIFKNCYKSQFLTDFDESGWKLKLSARILKKKFLVIISGVMTSSNDVINILTY